LLDAIKAISEEPDEASPIGLLLASNLRRSSDAGSSYVHRTQSTAPRPPRQKEAQSGTLIARMSKS